MNTENNFDEFDWNPDDIKWKEKKHYMHHDAKYYDLIYCNYFNCSPTEKKEIFKQIINANKLVAKHQNSEISRSIIKLDLKIIDILNRLNIAKNLIEENKNLKFGPTGLVFYLLLTCFDGLGQQDKDFYQFQDWIIKEIEGENDKELKTLSDSINKEQTLDILKTLSLKYNSLYGVKTRFKVFFEELPEG